VTGETAFALSYTAKVASLPETVVIVNGLTHAYGTGLTWNIAGSTLNWTGPYTLHQNDVLVVNYFS
jgi:hypothetical protein